ncbi:MAG: glycoside hydrolase family 15 protein, partial [Candidatus Dormibacteraeota bacterium]|nr:glycoside hydrolase family 15 protein [Candidatus Dormibacteraeota bacterium]
MRLDTLARAPGAPGAAAGWGPGRKEGFGTAPGRLSRVWFTIAQGNLSEVFYPAIDRPALLGLRFLVAAPGSPPVDDAAEAEHQVRWLEPGVPCFTVESRHFEYVLNTTFATDPESDVLLISGDFRPEMPDVRLYLQATPHGAADGTVLPRDPPALAAHQGDVWMVLVGPFSRCTAGYLNSSDLLVDLHDNDGAMTAEYESAAGGSVALGAELGFTSGPFHLAIGFGETSEAAESLARRALGEGAARIRQRYVEAWKALPGLPGNVLKVAGDGGDLARCSLAVLRSLEDKQRPGAFVAAPTAPWGIPEQSYARVWTRDLYQIASALLDAGDVEAAQRAVAYLEATQREDGSWPASMSVAGHASSQGLELDQVALPILLCWRLGVAGALEHDPWPTLVGPAAAFLVANGPGTPLDRWGDAGGLSPSTLAASIAALSVASAFAAEVGEDAAADHLLAVADCWNDSLESWTYVRTFRHYVRLGWDLEASPHTDDAGVSLEFVELVRRGLRRADDPRIQSSLVTADAPLRVQLADGPLWRRYAGDTYGETDDGRPWSAGRPGRGRPWPIMCGERGHLALANSEPVAEYVLALEACAGPELMLPEQVWDGRDLPAQRLFKGRGTGSAAPRGWAHAEYLKLLIAFATSNLPDQIAPARRRYAGQPPADPAVVWTPAHPVQTVQEGRLVRLQLSRPGQVIWTADGGASSRAEQTYDTRLGFWVADLSVQRLRPGTVVQWTLRHAD